MSQAQPDIDRLVREVLAQLGAGATGGLPASAQDDVSAATASAAGDGDFVLTCRVVTMSEVAGRLASMRRLVVPAQAVVTPAVRDELRRRDISLIYAPAALAAGSAGRLCLGSVGGRFDPAPLVAALAGQGVDVRASASNCLLAAVDRLAAEVVQPGTLGLLVTEHIAAALCLANRHRGVRAVSGADAAAIAATVAAVGANLLVLDPAVGSQYQLRQIITEFCRGGTRPCPEVFQERLA